MLQERDLVSRLPEIRCGIKHSARCEQIKRRAQLVKNRDYANGRPPGSAWPGLSNSQLLQSPVGVEKLFSRDFTNEIRSQVIECSFAVGAEIHRNYCFGSFFNGHA
jgi:hypothetical protein